ncbi:hypothetical protein ACJIZ3_003409 [Penstemon smallii]|uniref:Uncharacterized protein n=1 Tax=Penstemon smallii TaxID=265156 RepID=A0ABD3U988_9LAMI
MLVESTRNQQHYSPWNPNNLYYNQRPRCWNTKHVVGRMGPEGIRGCTFFVGTYKQRRPGRCHS